MNKDIIDNANNLGTRPGLINSGWSGLFSSATMDLLSEEYFIGDGFFEANNLAATIATLVEIAVAIIDGTNIEAGSVAPAAARTAITPSGKIVTLEVLIARNRHMALVAVPFSGLSLSNSVMAFMPIGVAAFPNPSIFAAMFMIMALMAGCSAGTSGNSLTITGLIARAMVFINPAFSATFIIPNHKAMAPMRLIAKVTAFFAESKDALVI